MTEYKPLTPSFRLDINIAFDKQIEDIKMNKKLAELSVNKSADYYGKLVKVLEDAGFILVLETETLTDSYYIVAESEDKI